MIMIHLLHNIKFAHLLLLVFRTFLSVLPVLENIVILLIPCHKVADAYNVFHVHLRNHISELLKEASVVSHFFFIRKTCA